MFPAWRLKLREVQVAVDSRRYEEAIALLERESLREFLPAKKLAQEVAGKMVARAGERFARGDSAAGWQDLAVAERLGGQARRDRQAARADGDRDARRGPPLSGGGPAGGGSGAIGETSPQGTLGRGGQDAGTNRQLDARRPKRRPTRPICRGGQLPSSGPRARSRSGFRRGYNGDRPSARIAKPRDLPPGRRKASGSRRSCTPGSASRIGRRCCRRRKRCLAIAPHHEAARQARRRAWKAVGMDVTHAHASRPAGGAGVARLESCGDARRPAVDARAGRVRVRSIP